MTAVKYLVLGGGNASGYVAREFVKQGIQPGELTIVTDEPAVSYERPALSKGYLAPDGGARLPGFHTSVGGGGERQDPAWYAAKGIDFKVNSKATAVDLTAKSVTLATGESLTYEKLIIATGARPVYLSDFKTPGAELEGIHYLRDIRDADKLLAGIKAAKESGRTKVLVVGGGYIGLEVSAMLNINGLEVTMVFPEPFFMSRLFTPELAAHYTNYYTAKGIKLLPNTLATRFDGSDGQVASVTLKSGETLPTDMVVVGVGARANVELFRGQLLEEGGGIKVDGHFRTSVPDVYAIGDVAAFPLKREGGRVVRQEHVTHCRQSGAHVVQHILGVAADEYDYLPFFYSREFSLSWTFYGSNTGEAVLFGDMGEGKFGALWVEGRKVVGGFMESGSESENNAVKLLVASGAALTEEGRVGLAEQGVKYLSALTPTASF